MTNARTITLGYSGGNDLWPHTLFESARSSLAVADAAVARMGPLDLSGPHVLTVLFLLAQSIELSLKSFLRVRGYSEDQLKSNGGLGHRLCDALDHAITEGFQSHQTDLQLLRVLDTTYATKRLQYHRASPIRLPLLRPTRELAHEYLLKVHVPLFRSSDERGMSIDPAADYGESSLAEFRVGAAGVDLLRLKE